MDIVLRLVLRPRIYNSLIFADYAFAEREQNQQMVGPLSQHFMNCAAQVIFSGESRDHVTPLVRDCLHWLRVREQVMFKLCFLVHKALQGLGLSYLADMLVSFLGVGSRACLWSQHAETLMFHKHDNKVVVTVAGLAAWNNLSTHVRTSETLTVFKSRPKTHLFALSYIN